MAIGILTGSGTYALPGFSGAGPAPDVLEARLREVLGVRIGVRVLPPGAVPQPPMRPEDEKLWAIGAQLGGLILGFVAPLIVWLVYRERSAFLDRTSKEALNFQLTLLIGYLVSFVLVCFVIGILAFFVVWIVGVVHAVLVINNHRAERRTQAIIAASRKEP